MPRNKRSPRQKSRMPNRGGNRVQMPGGVGDVPRAPRSDLITRSIALPRPTSRLVFHQHAPPVTIAASPTGDVANVFTFSLNGLNGSGTLQQLFDFYRIMAIRVEIRPQNTGINIQVPSTTALVPLYCTIDYNDATPPATSASMQEVDNCAILSAGESLTRTFQPRMSSVVRSAAGTDYMSVVPQWLNTGSDDVLHFGIKTFVPQVNAAQTAVQSWLVTIEYYIEFSLVSG